MCIAGLLIGITNLFLNGFVLKVTSSETSSVDTVLSFIRHNGVVDCFIGILTIYQNIFLMFLYVNFTECVFRNALICSTTILSMLIILGLNIEKYLKITQPYRYFDIWRPSVVKAYLIFVWVLAVIIAVSPHLLWVGQPPYRDYCTFFVVLKTPYLMCVGILAFVIIGAQVVMNLHIFIIALSKIVTDRRSVAPVKPEGYLPDWWKPAKIVLLIIGVNFFTVSPVGQYICLNVFWIVVFQDTSIILNLTNTTHISLLHVPRSTRVILTQSKLRMSINDNPHDVNYHISRMFRCAYQHLALACL